MPPAKKTPPPAPLGRLRRDDDRGFVLSARRVPCLGAKCVFILETEAEKPPARLVTAAARLLDPKSTIRDQARPWLAHYRSDCEGEGDGDPWLEVDIGGEIVVSIRNEDDSEDGVYLSIECECAWEVEHGLQLVIRDGRKVSKVGPFDGHLTLADAYADPELVGVIYKPR